MPITQKDIAREAGVSQAVVSDVLHGRPHGRVSPETKARILATAKRLEYRPHASAQALRSRQSHQLLYLALQPQDGLAEPILGGVSQGAAELGYGVVVEALSAPGREIEVLQDRLDRRVCDAALVRTSQAPDSLWPALRRLQEEGRSLLVIGQCPDPDLLSLAHDVPGLFRCVVNEMVARGRRRIAFLASPPETHYLRLVWQAWGMLAANPDPVTFLEGREARERWSAEEWAVACLKADPPPDVLLCYGDMAGIAAGAACRAVGRRPGQELDLVVVGGRFPGWVYDPGTVLLPTQGAAVGRQAAELLIRCLRGEPIAGPVRLVPDLVRVSS